MYSAHGEVLRELSEQGLADWEALAASQFFASALEDRRIVKTEVAGPALLRHERIPFISYPYEWPFEMLQDAACLQLDLLYDALEEGLVTKDASPYNVQWRGTSPEFVDVGSFERLRAGEPWAGYRQFCALSLYPLLLQAYKGLACQPWLRGSLEGISPAQCRSLMSARDLFRRGVLAHVVLHSRLEARHGNRARDVRAELRSAGFHRELIRANVKRLRRLVSRLRPRPVRSEWAGYREASPYTDADADRKEEFVRAAAATRRWPLVWDLGCNDGRYARAAVPAADYVVAIDSDERVVGELYTALKSEGAKPILPLSLDLADSSPALGWRGLERKPLPERGRPRLTLCLALVHHLAIARNIPFEELIGWLRELETAVVIEFATREDPMVQRLLAAKREGTHADYDRSPFERVLEHSFAVERSEELSSSTRVLYFARPRI